MKCVQEEVSTQLQNDQLGSSQQGPFLDDFITVRSRARRRIGPERRAVPLHEVRKEGSLHEIALEEEDLFPGAEPGKICPMCNIEHLVEGETFVITTCVYEKPLLNALRIIRKLKAGLTELNRAKKATPGGAL